MRILATSSIAALAATLAAFSATAQAPKSAPKTCATLGFTVNDFGKDEPTRQAKVFLSRLIVSTMEHHYIKGYTAGPPTVTCTFFTKFMGFDEYTCKAEAEVCWPGTRDPFKKKAPN